MLADALFSGNKESIEAIIEKATGDDIAHFLQDYATGQLGLIKAVTTLTEKEFPGVLLKLLHKARGEVLSQLVINNPQVLHQVARLQSSAVFCHLLKLVSKEFLNGILSTTDDTGCTLLQIAADHQESASFCRLLDIVSSDAIKTALSKSPDFTAKNQSFPGLLRLILVPGIERVLNLLNPDHHAVFGIFNRSPRFGRGQAAFLHDPRHWHPSLLSSPLLHKFLCLMARPTLDPKYFLKGSSANAKALKLLKLEPAELERLYQQLKAGEIKPDYLHKNVPLIFYALANADLKLLDELRYQGVNITTKYEGFLPGDFVLSLGKTNPKMLFTLARMGIDLNQLLISGKPILDYGLSQWPKKLRSALFVFGLDAKDKTALMSPIVGDEPDFDFGVDDKDKTQLMDPIVSDERSQGRLTLITPMGRIYVIFGCDVKDKTVLRDHPGRQFLYYPSDPTKLNDIIDLAGNTHLHYAAGQTTPQTRYHSLPSSEVFAREKRYRQIYVVLVNRGGDQRVKNKNSMTPLQYFLGKSISDPTELCYLLRTQRVKPEELIYAGKLFLHTYVEGRTGNGCAIGGEDSVEYYIKSLLEAGYPVDLQDANGETAFAVLLNAPRVFLEPLSDLMRLGPILVDYGADINTQNRQGDTLLHVVATMKDKVQFEELKKNPKLNQSICNKAGLTAQEIMDGVKPTLNHKTPTGETADVATSGAPESTSISSSLLSSFARLFSSTPVSSAAAAAASSVAPTPVYYGPSLPAPSFGVLAAEASASASAAAAAASDDKNLVPYGPITAEQARTGASALSSSSAARVEPTIAASDPLYVVPTDLSAAVNAQFALLESARMVFGPMPLPQADTSPLTAAMAAAAPPSDELRSSAHRNIGLFPPASAAAYSTEAWQAQLVELPSPPKSDPGALDINNDIPSSDAPAARRQAVRLGP